MEAISLHLLVEGYQRFSSSFGIETEVFSEAFVVFYRPERRLFKVLALPSDLPHGVLNLHWAELSTQRCQEGLLSGNVLD
jgi:hypothetical protein